jgi:succinoglycan biosynthesis protein ExoA
MSPASPSRCAQRSRATAGCRRRRWRQHRRTRAIVADLARETPPAPSRQPRAAAGQRRQCRRGRLRAGHTHLIRVDAHSLYPDDFVDILLAEATGDRRGLGRRRHDRRGRGRAAAAQRRDAERADRQWRGAAPGAGAGRLRRPRPPRADEIAAFRAVGGYDPDFAHNEDAELDHSLRAAGFDIWLTGRTAITYFPRRTLPALARQYFNFGRGQGGQPHQAPDAPRLRQLGGDLGRADALAAWLAPLVFALALPALAWGGLVLAGGAAQAVARRSALLLLSGPVAMLMHLCWSMGFWTRVLVPLRTTAEGAHGR